MLSLTRLSKLKQLLPNTSSPLIFTNPLLKIKNLHNQPIKPTSQTSSFTRSNPFYNNLFIHLKSPTSLTETRKLHTLLQVHGVFHPTSLDVWLGPQLVSTYVSFDCLQEALLVFNQLTCKNSFASNAILRGFNNVGNFLETIEFYHQIIREGIKPDNFTYPLVLKACSGLSDVEEGRKIQNLIQSNKVVDNVKPNIFVECAMIDMFAKCGSLDEAREVFDKMSRRDLVSWSAIISGTVQNGDWYEALFLFKRMRLDGFRPDSVIVATVLPTCGRLRAQLHGMALQGCACKSGFHNDLFVSNALIDMYGKCGDTREARHVFDGIFYKDLVSWSTMIAANSQNSEYRESLELYVEMEQSGITTNAITIASVLPALSNLKLLKQGKEMHNYIIKHGFGSDIFVGSALIDMYATCGSMIEAKTIFEIMSDKDITIWNSMIMAYVLNEDVDSALVILRRAGTSKLRTNSITIVSVLPLCTRMGLLRPGKETHSHAIRNGLGGVVSIGNSLIDMYCKCGNLENGVRIFNQMVEKDTVTYNTIIAAHSVHGHGELAFSFFDEMNEAGVKPDKLTFIGMLSACSHAGLVDKGWYLYNSMTKDHGILPGMEHYSCMVDLLGRSGHLDEAWEFIKSMPIEPEVSVLGSLLGSCRVHNRIELAEIVAEEVLQKNMDDPGYYILLANIYSSTGRWLESSKVRSMIKEKGLTKKPGNSWIQVGSCIHMFQARDQNHKDNSKIQEILDSLMLEMKDEGYLPDITFSSGYVPREDKLMQSNNGNGLNYTFN